MIARRAAVITVVTTVAVIVMVWFSGLFSEPPPLATSQATVTATAEPTPRYGGALADCSTRSEAHFPGAFDDPANLIVGPLVLVGGAYTPASTVREFDGNKFPLLVKAGRNVTVRLGRAARGAGLAYGPLPQGRRLRVRDAYRSVTFAACRPGRAPRHYSLHGPSASYADDIAVTFWSGFVLTRAPACIPLEIYVDEATTPINVGLPLGRDCTQ
jgi:hypothetical protein